MELLQNYLSSTTCLKELRLNFCSDKMKVEPILRAVADNDLLPFERVELQCERCQINNNVYEYLLTFIKKSTTLQSCPLKLLHINYRNYCILLTVILHLKISCWRT